MEKLIHKASERGFANHGWLNSAHSFSFANYYNKEKLNFGMLRVLNDDIIAPSKGFDIHPHHNMEIITIPLSGSLRHGDNMGNEEVLTTGEVQVMSAGTGVWHSEHNASDTAPLNLFQIWIFSDEKGHEPRYEQKLFSDKEKEDKWQLLVSPDGENGSLWIHQDAFISTYKSVISDHSVYELNYKENGVYLMLVDGEAEIEGVRLQKRDAVGFWNLIRPLKITFLKNSQILAIEVPMK